MIHYFDTDAEINKSFEEWKAKHASTAADPEIVRAAYVAGIWEGCQHYVLMPRDEYQRRAEHSKEHTQHTHVTQYTQHTHVTHHTQ